MRREGKRERIDTPTSRGKLEMRPAPYWRPLKRGCSIGYWKGKRGGTWLAKFYSPELNPARRQVVLGPADDPRSAGGLQVLSYEQALEKSNEWFKLQVRRVNTGDIPAGPYKVQTAMVDYLDRYQKRGGRALKVTAHVINAHILPSLGKIEVEALTRSRVQSWFDKITDAPARIRSAPTAQQRYKAAPDDFDAKRKRRSTANRILSVLKAALNLAVEEERVACSGNSWKLVKPHRKADGVRMRFLAIEEQRQLVEACESSFRNLVQAALHTGARYGELRKFRVRDFDVANGQIFISAESKTMEIRHVVLTSEGVTFFQRMTADRKGGELIFLAKTGKSWGVGHQVRPLKEAVKAAGIEKGLTFHELRHTYASTLVMAGAHMAVVAEQLGHKGTRMVEKHYGHLAKGYVAQTVRSLSPVLNLDQPTAEEALSLASA